MNLSCISATPHLNHDQRSSPQTSLIIYFVCLSCFHFKIIILLFVKAAKKHLVGVMVEFIFNAFFPPVEQCSERPVSLQRRFHVPGAGVRPVRAGFLHHGGGLRCYCKRFRKTRPFLGPGRLRLSLFFSSSAPSSEKVSQRPEPRRAEGRPRLPRGAQHPVAAPQLCLVRVLNLRFLVPQHRMLVFQECLGPFPF